MSLIEMINEPGYRQAVIAGTAGVFGMAHMIWQAFHMSKFNSLEYMIKRIHNQDAVNEEYDAVKKKDKILYSLSSAVPAVIGFARGVENQSCLGNSYVIEASSDAGSALAGYYGGRIILKSVVSGISNVGEYFQNKKSSKKK